MEVIKNVEYEILDNILIVTLPDGIQDNSQYEIRVKGLKSIDGKAQLEELKYRTVTELSPSYCNVSDVSMLQDTFGIPENTILYYIRSAYKYADYIVENSATVGQAAKITQITVPIQNFVITKVMLDCLLNAFINKAAGAGIKGTLGKISFENTEKYASNIDDLLDFLKAQLKMWEYAIRGYNLEGKAKPIWAKKAYKTQDPTTFAQLINDINRELPTPV